MTRLALRSLRPGDLVQDRLGDVWVVTSHAGPCCIATRTVPLLNPEEWELVASTLDLVRREPPAGGPA